MNENEINEHLEKIRKEVRGMDWEAAHAYEDDLYEAFVRDIADGDSYDADMARLVLTTKDMGMTRWYS